MIKKAFLILLCFLLLLPVVFAVPPWQQQSAANTGQLSVVVPKVEYAVLNNNFEFHVHVYNTAGILQTNTTTDCYMHTYNNTGDHITITEMSFDGVTGDFQHIILGTDELTQKGYLPYNVWCNQTIDQTELGGFFSGSLEINDETVVGYVNDRDSTHGVSIVIFMLVAALLFFLLPKIMGGFAKNEFVNLLLTRCCITIGFYLMVMNSAIMSGIAQNSGYAASEIFRYLWLFGIVGYLMMVFTFIKTLFDVVKMYNISKAKKRGLD